jgi:hypothetical protein
MDLFFRDEGGLFVGMFSPSRLVAWYRADKPMVISMGSQTCLRGSFVGAELRRTTMLEF